MIFRAHKGLDEFTKELPLENTSGYIFLLHKLSENME